MYDWKLAIVENYRWRQAAEDFDTAHLYPMGAPKVAATEQAIALAERECSFRFPDAYTEFLRHADGWPSFCENMDLFATHDFLSGEAKQLLDRNTYAVAFMRKLGLMPQDYIAVGADRDDLDLFLLISRKSPRFPGSVIWHDDEELERFASFPEFFSSMIAFNRTLAEGAGPDGSTL